MPRDTSKAQAAAAAARAARRAASAQAAAPPVAEPKPAPVVEPFNGADPAKFDHDNNGEAGGSPPGGNVPKGLLTTVSDAADRAAAQKETAEAAERAAAQREAVQLGEMKVPSAGPTNKARSAADHEAAERAPILKARRAVDGEESDPVVQCRITKKGDGKVSTGQHAGGIGEAYYLWKETPSFPRSIAKALEERDFVEIEGEEY
jgi:hypothetical protein